MSQSSNSLAHQRADSVICPYCSGWELPIDQDGYYIKLLTCKCAKKFYVTLCPECSFWNPVILGTGGPITVTKCRNNICGVEFVTSMQNCSTCRTNKWVLGNSKSVNRVLCLTCFNEFSGATLKPLPATSVREPNLPRSAPANQSSNATFRDEPRRTEAASIEAQLSALQVACQKIVNRLPESPGQLSRDPEWKQLLDTLKQIRFILGIPAAENVLDDTGRLRHGPLSSLSQKVHSGLNKIENLLLGSLDPETKTRRLNHLPLLITNIVKDSMQELSGILRTESLQEQTEERKRSAEKANGKGRNEAKSKLEGQGGADGIPTAGPMGLSEILELSESLSKLNSVRSLKLMERLPDLFNKMELIGRDLPSLFSAQELTPQNLESACSTVQERIQSLINDWTERCYVVRVIPEKNSAFNPDLQEMEKGGELTRNRELDQRIFKVSQPGYIFDDGKTRITLQKPRVILWQFG